MSVQGRRGHFCVRIFTSCFNWIEWKESEPAIIFLLFLFLSHNELLTLNEFIRMGETFQLYQFIGLDVFTLSIRKCLLKTIIITLISSTPGSPNTTRGVDWTPWFVEDSSMRWWWNSTPVNHSLQQQLPQPPPPQQQQPGDQQQRGHAVRHLPLHQPHQWVSLLQF